MIGWALIILAVGASVTGMIYAGNTYGNLVAKRCIEKGGEWRLVDNRYSNYECRLNDK